MIYVSEETRKDCRNRRQRRGPAEHVIVLRDTGIQSFRLESYWRDLPNVLETNGIKLTDICGLAQSGYQTVLVTPVTVVEISVLRCLHNPRIMKRHRTNSEMNDPFFCYGWYNVAITGGACSVARLLLEKCPRELNTIGGSIEWGKEVISIYSGDGVGVVEYLTFDLHDFVTFNRIRTKNEIFKSCVSYNESFPIEWKAPGSGTMKPRSWSLRF